MVIVHVIQYPKLQRVLVSAYLECTSVVTWVVVSKLVPMVQSLLATKRPVTLVIADAKIPGSQPNSFIHNSWHHQLTTSTIYTGLLQYPLQATNTQTNPDPTLLQSGC